MSKSNLLALATATLTLISSTGAEEQRQSDQLPKSLSEIGTVYLVLKKAPSFALDGIGSINESGRNYKLDTIIGDSRKLVRFSDEIILAGVLAFIEDSNDSAENYTESVAKSKLLYSILYEAPEGYVDMYNNPSTASPGMLNLLRLFGNWPLTFDGADFYWNSSKRPDTLVASPEILWELTTKTTRRKEIPISYKIRISE